MLDFRLVGVVSVSTAVLHLLAKSRWVFVSGLAPTSAPRENNCTVSDSHHPAHARALVKAHCTTKEFERADLQIPEAHYFAIVRSWFDHGSIMVRWVSNNHHAFIEG